TAFLQAVSEAHAADLAAGTFVPEAYPLLTSLLDGIVERVAPPFVVSEVEGDAVFTFAPDGQLELRGPSVLACLAGCYEGYRARHPPRGPTRPRAQGHAGILPPPAQPSVRRDPPPPAALTCPSNRLARSLVGCPGSQTTRSCGVNRAPAPADPWTKPMNEPDP